jgi:hypothetical protein
VHLEVLQVDKCKLALDQSAWKELYQIDQSKTVDHFTLKMSKREIPLLIKYLTSQDVDIVGIDYRNQLEEYFLKITHS